MPNEICKKAEIKLVDNFSYKNKYIKQMTWKQIIIILLAIGLIKNAAPFVALDTVHQAYSQFQVNLILNENRNHPIILTTTSRNQTQDAARQILQKAHQIQPHSGFSVLIDCRMFNWNLNHSLGLCVGYDTIKQHKLPEDGSDAFFNCQIMIPSQVKIKQKGHTIMKNHNQQSLPEAKYFNSDYLAEVLKKNVPDFVYYIEDQYQLTEFLQEQSDFKVSKQPKLMYFDQNLLAPAYIRKLSAQMDGKIQVAVTDDPPIAKLYQSEYDTLILLQYSFDKKKYQHRRIAFDQYSFPEASILSDPRISKYMKVKKNRDILLDFQHINYTVYEFDTVYEIEYLQTHGRAIVVQVSENSSGYSCSGLHKVGEKYTTLFNYVCFSQENIKQLDPKGHKHQKQFLFVTNSIATGQWIPKDAPVMEKLPQNISRQRVSTQTEAQHCMRTASISERDPIFFYFSEKGKSDNVIIMNYLNSLPEVTSLLYMCQIYLPDESLVRKFGLKINTLFILYDPDQNGSVKKLEHTKINNFLQIKMFLREIAIQKMLGVYEKRIIHNTVQKIDTAQQLTDKCFNRKCIIALIASGRYREQEEMKIIKQLKLQFVWIDGICHWDVPRQLKLLKKKEKVIDRSYVFFYNEKDISYSLWESKKFWDKKDLEKWIKSLRNTRKINHLKFAIDIEDRICKAKKVSPQLPDEL